mmetsp:Transcript_33756/g.81841  ORF Transcript_33756/g.81841 Transcript_33756/m.81841 type:complete len:145 (+) Transcript_33756:1085-1519(+)
MKHFQLTIFVRFGLLYVTVFATTEPPRPVGKRLRGNTQMERQLSDLAEPSSIQPSIAPSIAPSMAPFIMAARSLQRPSSSYESNEDSSMANQQAPTKKPMTIGDTIGAALLICFFGSVFFCTKTGRQILWCLCLCMALGMIEGD